MILRIFLLSFFNEVLLFYSVAVPKLNVDSDSGYHGLVKENETLVEVTPPIRATGAEICSFRIINKHHIDAPFEVSGISLPSTSHNCLQFQLFLQFIAHCMMIEIFYTPLTST